MNLFSLLQVLWYLSKSMYVFNANWLLREIYFYKSPIQGRRIISVKIASRRILCILYLWKDLFDISVKRYGGFHYSLIIFFFTVFKHFFNIYITRTYSFCLIKIVIDLVKVLVALNWFSVQKRHRYLSCPKGHSFEELRYANVFPHFDEDEVVDLRLWGRLCPD